QLLGIGKQAIDRFPAQCARLVPGRRSRRNSGSCGSVLVPVWLLDLLWGRPRLREASRLNALQWMSGSRTSREPAFWMSSRPAAGWHVSLPGAPPSQFEGGFLSLARRALSRRGTAIPGRRQIVRVDVSPHDAAVLASARQGAQENPCLLGGGLRCSGTT